LIFIWPQHGGAAGPLRKRANIKQKQFYEEIPSCQQVWARPLSGGEFAVVTWHNDEES
jgi:hypothetical protein